MTIKLFGQQNNLGIGIHFANFAQVLKRRSSIGTVEEIDHTDTDACLRTIEVTTEQDVNISFVGMNIHEYLKGLNIQWTVFESTKIPDQIIEPLVKADQVWVPSTWGQKILVDAGLAPERVWRIPEGVDPDKFYPKPRVATDRPFRFLFVGKYEQRKSIDELFQAWSEAFGGDPTVELIVKTSYFVNDPDRVESMRRRVSELNAPNLTVIYGEAPDNELIDLYRSADVFVFPSKSEAWGLPLIEAAAMGIPIITTNYSGHCDFLADIKSSCLFVDYDLADITCPDYLKYYPDAQGNHGQWAIPRVSSLVECLKQARLSHENLTLNAVKNSEIIRKNWSWTRSVDLALVAIGSASGF